MAMQDQIPARSTGSGQPATLTYPAASADTVPAAIAEVTERYPHRPALRCGGRSLTYRELDELTASLAGRIAAAGVRPGQVVAVCCPDRFDQVVRLLAVWRAGAVYLAVDPGAPAERTAFLLGDTAAVLTLTGRDDELPAGTAALPGCTPGQLAYLVHTSGTTGVPKAVAVAHGPLAGHITAIRERFGIEAADTVLHFARPTVDVAVEQVASTLTAGACLVVPPAALLSAGEFLQLLDAEQVSVANVAAGYFADLVAALRAGRPAPARLHTMISGSDRLFPAAAADWLRLTGIRLLNAYGPTETVITATAHDVGPAGPVVPIGLPVGDRGGYLLDERLNPVADGETGQLYLGGTALATGYLNRPGLTADRFLPDPFARAGQRMYRTGDLARRGVDGALEFLGRTDEQVKVRGFRVELGEVESAIAGHPSVLGCAVAAYGSPEQGYRLAAYLVAPGGAPNLAELRDFLAATLPEQMIPASLTVLDALPLTTAGKVDRAALPEPAAPVLDDGYLAPATPAEQLIAGIWADVLGVAQVGLADNFFHLGGDSLTAVRVAGRVFEVFGPVSPYLIFEVPTLAGFAAAVSSPSGQSGAGPRRRSAANAPLSPFQRGLWLLDCWQPGTSIYNVPWLFEFTGEIEARLLRQTLRRVVERHEVLRTTFRLDGTLPRQVIAPAADVAMPVSDLTGLPDEEQQSRRAELIRSAAQRPFDLATGPLLRAELIRTDPRTTTLLLVFHHIVWDEGSLPVLERELRECYAALAAGRAPRLPELAVQYADYAAWLADQEPAGEHLAYWAEQLRDVPTRPAVTADRPRPVEPTHRGSHRRFEFEPELADAVREFARSTDATPFMVLLAGLALAVHRREGVDDLVIGSPVSVRSRPELEALIGYFINVLPLRFRIDPDASLRDLLDLVRTAALGGYQHQQVPLEEITGRVLAERSAERHQLFQLAFEMHTATAGLLPIAGTGLSARLHVNELSRFDLSWSVEDDGTGFSGRIEYDTDLFDGATAAQLEADWLAAVTALVTDPEQPVRGRVPAVPGLLPPVELDLPVHALFERQAELRPAAIALIAEPAGAAAGPVELSYAELNARANRVARWLAGQGVGAGAVVGVEVPRGLALVVGLLGVLKAGAGYTLLDPELPGPRRAAAIADAGVRLVLTGELIDAVEASGDDSNLDLPVPVDAVACVMFTSGSTGRPKGVLASHRALAATYLGQDYADFGPDEVWLQCSPVSWDAFGLELYGALLFGGSCVLQPGQRPEPETMARLVARHRVTQLQLSASLFNLLVDEFAEIFDGLKVVFTGGERASATHLSRLRARRPKLRIGNGYGPVESMGFTTCHPVSDADLAAAAVPIGTAVRNKRAYVLDHRFRPAATGEILTAGDGLALGYVGQPGLTAERFLPDPFGPPGARMYRTSDLGSWNPDGTLAISGRADDQVKIRGFRVEPAEVAVALGRHPAVVDCAVVAYEPVPGDTQLAAYLTSRTDQAPGTEQILDHLMVLLPDYMLPSSVTVLPAMPLTANGKLDRAALPAPLPPRPAESSGSLDGDAERLVAEVWAEVLGVAPTDGQDNFFRLGGNSLAAVRVALLLSRRAGRRITPQLIFATRTVSALARRLPA